MRDLENAVHFYEKLGFALCNREIQSGPFLDQVVGISAARIETVKLKAPCGSLIELLQYHSHPLHKKIVPQSSNQLGWFPYCNDRSFD